MKTTTQMPTMMEILVMAKSLLVDRYLEEKSRCVMRWQMLNDYGWSTNGEILSCPDMPEYPTTDEILDLARHIKQYFEESEHTESGHADGDYSEESMETSEISPQSSPFSVSSEHTETGPNGHDVYAINDNTVGTPSVAMTEVPHAPVEQSSQPS